MSKQENETASVTKSLDEWSALIDLLDIAADELQRDGHEAIVKKLEIASVVLSNATGLGS